jgi:hypothetical protein
MTNIDPPPERYQRFIGPETQRRIASLANVADDPALQDWPLEVADPDRLPEFLGFLSRADDDDDRFALMALVLYSLDEVRAEQQRTMWPAVKAILEKNPRLFADQILYWSCGEELDDGCWQLTEDFEHQFSITPVIRQVLARVAGDLGLRLSK